MKIRFIKFLFWVISFFIIPTASLGATYYMRSDGLVDNKDMAKSCSTANSAMSVTTHNKKSFSDGDEIIICDDGGIYTTAFDTPSDGVTYKVADGDSVTLVGPNSGIGFKIDQDDITLQLGSGKSFTVTEWGSTNSNMISVTGDNATIDGLTIHSSNNGGINVDGCSGTVIKNCTLYDIGNDTADEFVAFNGGASNWIIQYCEIYGNDRRGIDGILVTNAHDGIIEYNFIHDIILSGGEGGEQAIDIKNGSYNITVRYNYIKNITDSGGIIVHSNYKAVHGINIIGNFFENCMDFGITLYPRDGKDLYDVDITANLFANIDGPALNLTSAKSGDNWYQVRVYNNTFVNNGKDSRNGACPLFINGGSTEKQTTGTGSDSISNFIKNNIFHERKYEASSKMMYDNDSSGKYVVIEYNRFYDSYGSAQCKFIDAWYDCDSAQIGRNNEISATSFTKDLKDITTDGTFALLRTNNNVTPAENLEERYGEGLAESTNWKNVTNKEVYTAKRDQHNSGKWGKGAVVYGSASTIKKAPTISIQNPPQNLRVKKDTSGG